MIECKYKNNGCCNLASDLACLEENSVPAGDDACSVCIASIEPMQINQVTVSLAISRLHDMGLFDQSKYAYLHDLSLKKCAGERIVLNDPPACGVGSILSRKLSWFVKKDESCLICRYRVARMNEWGPDGCEKNMEVILVWLKHSANKRKIPFFKQAVQLVVQSAIMEERKNLCCKKT